MPNNQATVSYETIEDLQPFLFQQVEVIGGRKFPLGTKAECIKVGISIRNHGKPYCMLSLNGENVFCDPMNLKVLKALPPAKQAAHEAAMEEARDATMLIACKVTEEREKSVKIQHTGWYSQLWLPKVFVEIIGDFDEDTVLVRLPKWKLIETRKAAGVAALEELQEAYQARYDEIEAEANAKAAAAKPISKVGKKLAK
jgi:hypothetical protein